MRVTRCMAPPWRGPPQSVVAARHVRPPVVVPCPGSPVPKDMTLKRASALLLALVAVAVSFYTSPPQALPVARLPWRSPAPHTVLTTRFSSGSPRWSIYCSGNPWLETRSSHASCIKARGGWRGTTGTESSSPAPSLPQAGPAPTLHSLRCVTTAPLCGQWLEDLGSHRGRPRELGNLLHTHTHSQDGYRVRTPTADASTAHWPSRLPPPPLPPTTSTGTP